MHLIIRPLFLLTCCIWLSGHIGLSAQGFVSYPPLAGSAAYQVEEQPGGILKVFGNHNNFNFNAKATLSSYYLTPQGIYLGIGDSLQNTNTNDYWLWLTDAEDLITFRTRPQHDTLEIERFLPDSTPIFRRTLAFSGATSLFFGNVKELANGDLFVFGLVDTNATIHSPNMQCMRLDAQGNVVWSKSLEIFPGVDIVVDAYQAEIREIPNGDVVIVLMADQKPMFVRLKGDGTTVYRTFYQSLQLAANPVAAIADDGSMFVTINDAVAGALYLLKLDANANVLWQKDLRSAFNAEVDAPGTYQLLINQNNNVTFAGTMLLGGVNRQLIIAEFAQSNGALVARSDYAGMDAEAVRLFGSTRMSNGSLFFCGTYAGKAVVIKTDAAGNIFDGQLVGRVAIDLDNDCIAEATEPPMRQWLVEAKSTNGAYYTYTDTNGAYNFDNLDSAQYIVKLKQQGYTWETCPDSLAILVRHDTITANIAAVSIFDCPVMKIEVAAPFVRYCATNTWHVNYRNFGSTLAENVKAEISLDPRLIFTSASITPSNINGSTLQFNLPNVQPGDAGHFSFTCNMDCATTGLGQTICVSASITPDTLCINQLGSWTGGLLEAIPSCENDTVKFQLINRGKNPTGVLEFIIVEDHIFLRNEPVNLNPGQVKVITQYAANNGTIRLRSEQVAGHPLAVMPDVAVEGCTPSLLFSTGYLTELPNQTGSPFNDRFCDEIIGSFDPNDKNAAPTGYGPSDHFIDPNTPIEYLIRFQNTGTDTAFRVVIVDTLSSTLDMSTVRPGPSSHPYEFAPTAQNTLVFKFDPIALPDSNINEAASHGFVQFWVNQKPNLPNNTLITNTAHIYFDNNFPVQTNTYWHRVHHTISATDEPRKPSDANNTFLHLSPNPADNQTTATWLGASRAHMHIQIVDAFGRAQFSRPMHQNTTQIDTSKLPAGTYQVLYRNEYGAVIAQKALVVIR
jgi:uncharacterized repeat protein (TIGR01451 family)